TDGGTKWAQHGSGTKTDLSVVDFVDQNTGWVCGSGCIGGCGGEILKTTDGGNSWVSQIKTASPVTGISFVDSETGWAVGGNISGGAGAGILLKNNDGGATWTNQSYN